MDSRNGSPRRGVTRLGAAGYRSTSESITGFGLSPYRSADAMKVSQGRASNFHGTDLRQLEYGKAGSSLGPVNRDAFKLSSEAPRRKTSNDLNEKRGRDDGAAEEHGLDGFDATMNRHMLSPASSPYLHPPKTAPAGRSQGRGGGGSKVEEDKQSSIRPGTSASNDQVRLNKLLQTYGKTSTPTHRPSPSSVSTYQGPAQSQRVPSYQGPAQSQRVPTYQGPAQNHRVAGSRQQPAASPSRMPVASALPRQTALATPNARPDSAVGSDRPQSGNLRLSADLLAAWGNQCAISTPRPEAAAAGATRPQSGMRGLAVDLSPENSPSALHTAAAAATVGVRTQQQLGMSATSRPISARPGSARGGAVQQASMTTPLMRSSGSFSRDNFDILDVSDDDRLDGEEPLLEERGGQPVHTRMVTTYGMTLDQYMSRMVTTPASAASTSGLGTPVGNKRDSRSAYNTAQYQPVIDRVDINVLDSLVSDNAPHPGAAHGGQHGGQHGRPGSALGKPRSAAPRPATSSRRGSAEYGASMWQEVASFEGQAGIASAIQNSLDLRPATAAAPNFTPGGSSSSGGPHRQHRYGSSLMHEHVVGDHGDLIKETDLGGLSASLFMPNAERYRGLNSAAISSKGDSPHAQPAPPALHGSSTAASGRLSNATSSGSELASGPSGRLLNLVSSVNASAAADPTIKANNAPASSEFQRVFPSSNKLPGGTINPGAATSPRAAAEAAPSRVLLPKAGQGVLQAQHEDDEVDPLTAAPQQRMVQSARPVTRGGSELDASVWQNTIAVQLERPPSRQKPPAEALHLWALGEGLSGMQDVMQLGPHSRARARPQTAAASTYRAKPGQRAQATSGLPQHSTARPPSRQKPPPVSLRHQHEFCSEEMMKPMEAPSEEEYELSEFSDSSDI